MEELERWEIVQVVAAPPGWRLVFKESDGCVELFFLGLVRRWTEAGGGRSDERTALEPLRADEGEFVPATEFSGFLEMRGPDETTDVNGAREGGEEERA